MRFKETFALLLMLLMTASLHAQIRDIDRSKLPESDDVKKALSAMAVVEPFARVWSPTWRYDTPKKDEILEANSALKSLKAAERVGSQNEEFLLLEGLAAHFAYNLGVDNAYDTTIRALTAAHKLAPGDYRADWFYGIHLCQSEQAVDGMKLLLAIEDQIEWGHLPVDYWTDYIDCSAISVMPEHTLRAVDHAEKLGASARDYGAMVDIAQQRLKETDAKTTYPAHEAWQMDDGGAEVRFTSQLCGMSLGARSDWRVDMRDVANGTCVATFQSGPYHGTSGDSAPTILLFTRLAKPNETPADFAQTLMRESSNPKTLHSLRCPKDDCLEYELLDPTKYPESGGGHALVVVFASAQPEYPGLLFEKPQATPHAKSDGKAVVYHPDPRLRRLPGTLYTFVLLDSNESIFNKAMLDLDYFLRSIQLD